MPASWLRNQKLYDFSFVFYVEGLLKQPRKQCKPHNTSQFTFDSACSAAWQVRNNARLSEPCPGPYGQVPSLSPVFLDVFFDEVLDFGLLFGAQIGACSCWSAFRDLFDGLPRDRLVGILVDLLRGKEGLQGCCDCVRDRLLCLLARKKKPRARMSAFKTEQGLD